jgi:hypothetical protein
MATNIRSYLQICAGLILGIIIPLFLLINVITSVSSLEKEISYKEGFKQVADHFVNIKHKLKTENDYALISMLAAENANQKTMINKQVMKVAVIQIGFSVISIGLLFVVLGFNEGGIEASSGSNEFSFNVKAGSSGLAAIIIGAAMATMGGVMKNEYKTVPVPKYFSSGSSKVELALNQCSKQYGKMPELVGECMKAYVVKIIKSEGDRE